MKTTRRQLFAALTAVPFLRRVPVVQFVSAVIPASVTRDGISIRYVRQCGLMPFEEMSLEEFKRRWLGTIPSATDPDVCR